MQDKIIAAIAGYLDEKTEFKVDFIDGQKTEQVYFRDAKCSDSFLQEIATEIVAAIAPHLEAGEEPRDWWKKVIQIQNESIYTFELVISGVIVGYASKAGLKSKYTFHPAQHLALSAAHLNAIAAAIKHYNK